VPSDLLIPSHAYGAAYFKVKNDLEFKPPEPPKRRNEQQREHALMETGTFHRDMKIMLPKTLAKAWRHSRSIE